MKMDEYLQKKKEVDGQEKELQLKRKELENAERKAQEIRAHLKEEKKKERSDRVSNFSLLGMQFRPWTLNDMIIILFIVAILVIGGISFMPGGEVSSDVDSDQESFFSKLFGGFTVKSLSDSSDEDTTTDIEEDTTEEDTTEEDTSDDSSDSETNLDNMVDFDMDIKYQDSTFTTINVTNVDYLWYTLSLRNKESFNIKCTINHYVNNELKEDKSIVTIEAGNMREIKIRELGSDSVNTLSRVKLEVSCSNGQDISTESAKVENLKFYFS